MELGLKEAIENLTSYWKKQDIVVNPKPMNEIDNFQKKKKCLLPNDFQQFYSIVNGMGECYPNDMDKEGFLFYPLEAITSVQNELTWATMTNREMIFIFAEYLHASWWYGFELMTDGSYKIGIIATDNFKPITNSLSEFIALYMEDSPLLYDYE
jgi:SMI1 / KNR4 family (SUKH-1)